MTGRTIWGLERTPKADLRGFFLRINKHTPAEVNKKEEEGPSFPRKVVHETFESGVISRTHGSLNQPENLHHNISVPFCFYVMFIHYVESTL